MKSKKPIVILVVIICMAALTVFGLEKYFEMQDEKCIRFVREMQYPGYGSVTLDQALRNIGGTVQYSSPDYDEVSVIVEARHVDFTPLVMVFKVDMKNDREYLYTCSLNGNLLGEQEALNLLRDIYDYSY